LIAAGESVSPIKVSVSDGAFALGADIYSEARSIKATDGRETQFYESTFYLIIGNLAEDGKTLKRVQARIEGYETPVLAAIKDSSSNQIDIRHGEWAYFVIGRIVSKKNIGTFKGSVTVEDSRLRAFENNIPQGTFSFDVWSFETKREYGLASRPEFPDPWELKLVISADDRISMPIILNIDPLNHRTPVTYLNSAAFSEKG
jgi:hypothetical protein